MIESQQGKRGASPFTPLFFPTKCFHPGAERVTTRQGNYAGCENRKASELSKHRKAEKRRIA